MKITGTREKQRKSTHAAIFLRRWQTCLKRVWIRQAVCPRRGASFTAHCSWLRPLAAPQKHSLSPHVKFSHCSGRGHPYYVLPRPLSSCLTCPPSVAPDSCKCWAVPVQNTISGSRKTPWTEWRGMLDTSRSPASRILENLQNHHSNGLFFFFSVFYFIYSLLKCSYCTWVTSVQ